MSCWLTPMVCTHQYVSQENLARSRPKAHIRFIRTEKVLPFIRMDFVQFVPSQLPGKFCDGRSPSTGYSCKDKSICFRNLQGHRHPNLARRLRLEKAGFERVTAELVVLECLDRRIFYLGALNRESFL